LEDEKDMHTQSLIRWTHDHAFLGARHADNERRTWLVVALTAAMMVGEILGGAIYGSMALMADGWHMSTHAGALAIAALAYRYARKHLQDARFSFGTGKLGELAGYSSALILAMIAMLIGYQSVMRLFDPVAISFNEATVIAVVGLGVNLASAWLLRDEHGQAHEHEHGGGRQHRSHHHDHNLRAAYMHVLADAMTSVLAIVALLAGRFYGWVWMDPAMGIVGAIVIAHWSLRLLRSSGAVLLDTVADQGLAARIKERLEVGTDRVTDLHLWRLGPGHAAVIAAIVADHPESPDLYKARLSGLYGLSHVTIEVHACSHLGTGTDG
jgi:cation diffusion facilitator family transporter